MHCLISPSKLLIFFWIAILALCLIFFHIESKAQTKIDLTDPEQNLESFIKTRAALDGSQVVFWWTGSLYSFVEGEKSQHLFDFEGYNIARAKKVDQGYLLLTREASFYKDPQSGEILEQWENPFTKKTVSVIHVWNDPVNQKLFLDGDYGKFLIPTTESGDDLYWHLEIFLKYPSPLPREQYPLYSNSNEYQAGELFQYYTKRSQLEDASLQSVPCHISWTRISPWLPWMEMENRAGYLIYHCRGKKLANGFDSLPLHIKSYVAAQQPNFQTAPDEFTEPNETSWTYFKKLMQQRKQ